MALLQQLADANDPAVLEELGGRLLELVRSKFVEQDWFYRLYRGVTDTLKEMASDSTMSDIDYINRLLELTDMPKEEFTQLCGEMLDFGKFLLDQGVLTFTDETDPLQIIDSGILEEMGKVMNSSARMAEVKKLAIGMMLNEAGLSFEESMALLEKYGVGQLTEPAQQRLEVEALLLPGLSRDIPPIITVLRHPSLGEAALKDVQELVSFQEMMGLPEELELTEQQKTQLLEAVKQAAGLPFEELAQLDTGLGSLWDQHSANEMVDSPG